MTFARERVLVRLAQTYLGHDSLEIMFGYYQNVEEWDLRSVGRLFAKPSFEDR